MKNNLLKRLLAFVLAFAMIISGVTIFENSSIASDDTVIDEDDSGLTGDSSEGDIVEDTETEEKVPLRNL